MSTEKAITEIMKAMEPHVKEAYLEAIRTNETAEVTFVFYPNETVSMLTTEKPN